MPFDLQPMLDVNYTLWGTSAIYTPPGGPAVAVMVIDSQTEITQPGFGAPGQQQQGRQVDIRISEVAQPVAEATLQLDNAVWKVKSVKRTDDLPYEHTLILRQS